jgi:hypothetical protein
MPLNLKQKSRRQKHLAPLREWFGDFAPIENFLTTWAFAVTDPACRAGFG